MSIGAIEPLMWLWGDAEFVGCHIWMFVLRQVYGEVVMHVGSGQVIASVLQWDGNNLNSSNRATYWWKVKARIGGPSGILVQERDDAELADGVEASGSSAPVLKSALVSSCRIACVQRNNVNRSNRSTYAVRSLHPQVWGVECVFSCRLAGVPANRGLWQGDAELTDDQEASGSSASVLKSALVSSCRIACAQSNNISTSNRTAYEMGEGEGDNWRTKRHPCSGEPEHLRVALVVPCFAVVRDAAFALMVHIR
ncbi:hypothetical protein cyc_06748 [Cyclospora cayetanensis]|uniref:Uncharacterized protein n=1 Tax=Cyclospora cayetanensis TaxID=88456 RepID=A0A1D3CUQ0_9EIME|nr:hypothetical protein cyc_06748 [Cyclospora cayetanensis]